MVTVQVNYSQRETTNVLIARDMSAHPVRQRNAFTGLYGGGQSGILG